MTTETYQPTMPPSVFNAMPQLITSMPISALPPDSMPAKTTYVHLHWNHHSKIDGVPERLYAMFSSYMCKQKTEVLLSQLARSSKAALTAPECADVDRTGKAEKVFATMMLTGSHYVSVFVLSHIVYLVGCLPTQQPTASHSMYAQKSGTCHCRFRTWRSIYLLIDRNRVWKCVFDSL